MARLTGWAASTPRPPPVRTAAGPAARRPGTRSPTTRTASWTTSRSRAAARRRQRRPAPAHGPGPPLLPFQFPKKRGRKPKKLLEAMAAAGMEVPKYKTPVRSTDPNRPRKKQDRFNGLTPEELSKLTLPDHLAPGLDIVFIGINPGLFAAFKGHHYAGPGNHFWKCVYLAGLIPEPLGAEDDFRLIELKIGFTNIVSRTTKGSQDLTRKEIKEGGKVLLQKLQMFQPKIAVFNGKGIFEIFSGKKEFMFGKQPEKIEGTQT
ncbi:G/T mismatch-specific thymine DNA glycosylase-like, partial [Pollicipes pollicipes]|uniref:G/T mismatch-specific thymine DNA glycosylase-like n=1 Tax=Pollicipes pollicipes TaxID=41117 RepID=UPI001884B164